MSTRRTAPHDGPLSLTEVTWDRHTFQLPDRLPTSATSSQRNQYYRLTVNGIDAAARAPPSTKVNLLASRFEYAHALRETDGSLQGLYNSNIKGPVVLIGAPANTFTFSSPSLFDGQGTRIAFPAPNVPLNNAQCRNSRFYNFHVSVNARAAYTGLAALANWAQLSTIEFDVAVTLPRQFYHPVPVLPGAPPPVPHVDVGREALIPAITINELANPEILLTAVTVLHGRPPVLGFMSRPNNQLFIRLDERSFTDGFMTYFHTCRYKLLTNLLRSEYLGRDVPDSSAVTSQLQTTRQNSYKASTRQFVRLDIEKYYVQSTNIVNMFPYQELYPVDIAQLFWTGLSQDIKDQAQTANPPYVLAARPIGVIESNEAADRRLRDVKIQAQAFERQLHVVQNQVSRFRATASRSTGGTSGTNAFAVLPAINFAHNAIQLEAIVDANGYEFPVTAIPPTSAPEPSTAPTASNDPLLMASIHMSIAEEALQKATGGMLPPLECWGCTNHKVFHPKRFHSWRECPHRSDSQVQANAKKGLQQFLENRNKQWTRSALGPAPMDPKRTQSQSTTNVVRC